MKIAIIGHGVVGSGVAQTLLSKREALKHKTGVDIEVKYVLDLLDFPGLAIPVIHDFSIIEQDPEVSLVVETMGGLSPAFEYASRSLRANKDYVTSNKELVAQKGAQLLKIAKEVGRNFMFEASVGGAIPVIRPICQCLEANSFSEVSGILNGTTNFILERMINEGDQFDDALALAQELGYAEKDPSADIDGLDTCRKICILASLAYGKHVYPKDIHIEGIREIDLIDVQYAASWDSRVIKLIGKSKINPEGKLAMIVCPMIVRRSSLLSSVNGVNNAVLVRGDLVGDIVLYGRGAGKFPTASAVIADVIDCAIHRENRREIFWEDSEEPVVTNYLDELTQMYFRISIREKEDIDTIRAEFGNIRVLTRKNAAWSEFAFVTEEQMPEREVIRKIARCGVLVDTMIRVESEI